MSKAVLVMDMPSSCKECNMSVLGREPHTGQMCFRCMHHPTILVKTKETERPDWCPLVPMLEKVTEPIDSEDVGKDYSEGTMDGWNACIDAISGGKANEQS